MNNEERVKAYISLKEKIPDIEDISCYLNMSLIEVSRIINIIFVKLLIAEKRGHFENNR